MKNGERHLFTPAMAAGALAAMAVESQRAQAADTDQASPEAARPSDGEYYPAITDRKAGTPRMHNGVTMVRSAPKTGRNEPCPCGSRVKYKRCCGAR